MKKRKLLKSALLGSFLKVWVPPVVTAISLPVHARTSTSCNDLKAYRGIGYVTSCQEGLIDIYYEVLLMSDISGNRDGSFIGEVYDVYSNNPIHEISWKARVPEQPFFIDVYIKEQLLENETCDPGHLYLLGDLSPGQLFIETSCGTITIELGG